MNDENFREWSDAAPFWEKHAATIRTMFSAVTTALIEEAGIRKGQQVLDVAGGAGEPSLAIADLVGPNGSVSYTDLIAGMVSAAEAEARRRGIANVNFRRCPADSLPFADNSFDTVVSRLGIMFFPDPLLALREMRRVVRSGGKLSLVVWYKSEFNPFSYEVANVVSRLLPAQTPSLTHDAFRFAEPGKLAGLLKDAGATGIRERKLEFDIAAAISPEEFWEMRSETSGTLRDKLKAASVETRRQLKAEVLEAIRKYFSGDQMKFPAQVLIVTGIA
ncbi:MAG TPA: class I SAM-dependent methyltransferase [Pyrinomonadaceae bacterium]|nr:class I SAM-dependent methyltransferase [Pyrinomonadaceae bacterium]